MPKIKPWVTPGSQGTFPSGMAGMGYIGEPEYLGDE